MMVLVVGGSASGKSEYAEKAAVFLGNKKLYLATMRPFGAEAEKKIQRHQRMRSQKGFDSLDCYFDLSNADINGYDTVLVECMSNLLANELYRKENTVQWETVVEKLCNDLIILKQRTKHLVVVSNDVSRDGNRYDLETARYIQLMEQLNARLFRAADSVVEVVCSIPIPLKGELPC